MVRKGLNWITTTIGGADITRSVDDLIKGLPLQKSYEEKSTITDIICLTPSS
jgi:hypothetical protein